MPLAEPFLFVLVLEEAGFVLAKRQQQLECWPGDLLQLVLGDPSRQKKLFGIDYGVGILESSIEPRLTVAQLDQRLTLGLSKMWTRFVELWQRVEKGFSSSS